MSTGGVGSALAAFAVAATTLVLLTFGLAYMSATARDAVLERLRGAAPKVKRWGGALLLVVGAWMLSLAAFADFFAGVFPV